MELPDVNVLIYAHREDAPEHDKYAAWLSSLAEGAAPFALSSVTLSGFLRIVTNPRILQPATPMAHPTAFATAERTRHVYLGARFREREVMRTEPHTCLWAEHTPRKCCQHALQVAEPNVTIHQ